MGKALSLVAEQIKVSVLSERALPPVLVLVSDGQPTDNFDTGLKALMDQPWGKKAVRIAIAIGEDADLDVLQKFIGHAEITPLRANNPEALVNYIKWVSTAVLQSASSPASQMASRHGQTTTQFGTSGAISTNGSASQSSSPGTAPPAQPALHVPIPVPPDSGPISAADVW
jgi:uncharacterized protein YegL